jgi:hypothetical protein
LRGLPMAPAVAKQAVGEIAKEVTKSASAQALMEGVPSVSGPFPCGSDNPWQRLNRWALNKIKGGHIPPHKEREFRRLAKVRARLVEDEDIEALGSISAGARRRMHEKSAYRRAVAFDIEDSEAQTIYETLLEKAEKGLLS